MVWYLEAMAYCEKMVVKAMPSLWSDRIFHSRFSNWEVPGNDDTNSVKECFLACNFLCGHFS